MRFNNLIILFGLIFIAITLPIFFKTDLTSKSAQLNNDYADYLITATEGAVAAASSGTDSSYIFSTSEQREKAVETFYETLIQCFNFEYSSYKDMVKYYVPCIFMIDTDGYYIEYSIEYVDSSGLKAYNEVITPINKWAKTYSIGSNGLTGNTYHVEFHLDDTVSVAYINSHDKLVTYEGNYAEVYEKLGKPTELYDIFKDYTSFNNGKTDIIIDTLLNQLEYYINVHDESFNQFNNVQYEFTLPKITGEDWARLIDSPTVLSFLQGYQTPYDNSFLNIYALAGSEVEIDTMYYVTEHAGGEKTYHRSFCSHVSSSDKDSLYSMEQAAKHGAFPCQYCIR